MVIGKGNGYMKRGGFEAGKRIWRLIWEHCHEIIKWMVREERKGQVSETLWHKNHRGFGNDYILDGDGIKKKMKSQMT